MHSTYPFGRLARITPRTAPVAVCRSFGSSRKYSSMVAALLFIHLAVVDKKHYSALGGRKPDSNSIKPLHTAITACSLTGKKRRPGFGPGRMAIKHLLVSYPPNHYGATR